MEEDSLWGVELVEGIAAILFGIAAVFWPGLTLITLLYLFAALALIFGITNIIKGVSRIGQAFTAWILNLLLGVVQLGVGIYLLRHPRVTFTTFILLIGFMLIFKGVFEVVMALIDSRKTTHRVLLAIAGVLAVLVGIVILFQPVSSGVAFVWLLGLYALIIGPLVIAKSLEDHNEARDLAVRR